MINREIVYERNMTGSYMKIAAGIHAGIDEKLMLKRKLPGLLAVEKTYVDGEGQYWYNISGKQSLDTYCRVKEIGIAFIERLIISICSEMEILEWNLMQTSCLMLDPELIFITNSNQEIIFTVYPGSSGTVETEFQQLMEYLLTKIDHKDAHAVRAAYGIYEKTLLEGYSVLDIREQIVQAKKEQVSQTAEMQYDNPVMPQKSSVSSIERIPQYPRGRRPQEEPVEAESTRRRAKNAKKETRFKEQKNREKEKPWVSKIKVFLINMGILEPEERRYGGSDKKIRKPQECGYEEERYQKKKYQEEKYKGERYEEERYEERRYAEKESETRRHEKRKPEAGKLRRERKNSVEAGIVYPEEEMITRPQVEYRPTVCLSSMGAKPRGMLLYQGNGSFADISVSAKMTCIGYGEDADVKIPSETISQMHARIDHEDDAYYIEDLNSTNGTYVNDEALVYKERRKLNNNDVIRFADVRYRFC